MTSGSVELTDYLRVIRRRWLIVVAFTCAGLLAAGVVLAITKRTYTATASVYVTPLGTDSNRALQNPAGTVNMDNEAQLVTSESVARLAARKMVPPARPSRLIGRISVSVPPNTTVLDISCDEASAARAATCANATAHAYLLVRLANAAYAVSGSLAALQPHMASLGREIDKLNARLRSKKTSRTQTIALQLKARIASSQLDAVAGRVESLALELTSLQAPGNRLAGHVINSAPPPSSPSSPRAVILLPSGLVAGLILGLLAAFMVDGRDDRLHSRPEVERLLGIPVLVDVPEHQGGATPPAHALLELAEHAVVATSERSPGVLVAGASPEAGVSWTAAHLAVALSELCPGVILVSAANGVPLAAQLLGAGDVRGAAELAVREATVDPVAYPVPGVPDLRVIRPGKNRNVPLRQDLTGRRRLLERLRSPDRFVVVETPLTAGGSAALAFREFTDGAIIVIEKSLTTRRDAQEWLARLERMRIEILGAVLVTRLARARHPFELIRVERRHGGEMEPLTALAVDPERPARRTNRGP